MMDSNSILPLLGIIYVVVGIGELAFYMGEMPGFWRFLARFAFAVEVVPWPGLTLERLKGFRHDGFNALMFFDESSKTLFARRRHDGVARRMPAVVMLKFEVDERGTVLAVKARWGLVPFLGWMAFVLVFMTMMLAPWNGFDRSIPWFALTTFFVMLSVMGAVAFMLAKSAANLVLMDVECQVMELLEASRLKEQARQ